MQLKKSNLQVETEIGPVYKYVEVEVHDVGKTLWRLCTEKVISYIGFHVFCDTFTLDVLIIR